MDKSKLSNEVRTYIEEIAFVKKLTIEEAMVEVLNQYSKKHAVMLRKANWAADRAMKRYNDDTDGKIRNYFIE